MSKLRVATLNVLAPQHADGPRRRPVIKAALAALRADIVALQEVVYFEDGDDQAAELLGPDYQLVRHTRRSADGVGAAFGSRWPVSDVREIDLRVTDRVDLPWAAAVVARIEVPPPIGPLHFVHHKPSYQYGFAYERELQAVACARFVEPVSGHVVLAGDFDDTPDSSSVRFWTGKQSLHGTGVAYQDAWAAVHPDQDGHTFTPANPLVRSGEMPLEPGRRIDYVMARCGPHGPALEVACCRRFLDAPVGGVWASDHFGMVAEFRA